MSNTKTTNILRLSAAAILGVSGIAVGLRGAGVFGSAAVDPEACKRLESRFHVPVVAALDERFLPAEWKSQPYAARATEIEATESFRICSSIERELEKYPESVLSDFLGGIHLSRTLEIWGGLYGATFYGNLVFLTSTGARDGFTKAYFARSFHHEFSSVLMSRAGFDHEAWRAANPPDFDYQNDAVVAETLNQTWTESGDPGLYSQGVLTAYGLQDLENDINVYAEVLFSDPRGLQALASEYPAIERKAALLTAFYEGLDPAFPYPWKR